MSILLCQKEADTPFYIETMNIRIRSLQELCYVIYHYPVLALQELLSQELLAWFRDELSLGYLTARIGQIRAATEASGGDGTEDALLEILRDCNYYTPGETEACRRRLAFYRSLNKEDYAHARGVSFFSLKRYRTAIRCFEEELELLSEQERRTEERLRDRFRQRRAGVLCDIASVRAVLFEKKEALSVLSEAEALSPGEERSMELCYLLEQYMPVKQEEDRTETDKPAEDRMAAGTLPLEEQEKLQARFEEIRKRVLSAPEVRKFEEIALLDVVKRREALQDLLRKWKKEYRSMN